MNATPWIIASLALVWDLLAYPMAEQPFVHTQTYAVVIVLFLFFLVRAVVMQLRAGTELIAPREETIALAGTALASIATLLCCLSAPSVVDALGGPGEKVAIAEQNESVQFPRTAVPLQARNDLQATVIAQDGRTVNAGARLPLLQGDMMFIVHARTVADIQARSVAGDTLTITQPSGNAFLSPLLLFPKTTAIAELNLPSDAFAIPARNLTVRAFLVTHALIADPRVARMSNGLPGVLFSVDDANGKPLEHGIGFAADGLPQELAGVVLEPHLGLFPKVSVASVPSPIPMLIGIAALIFGGGTLWYRRRAGIISP